MQSTLIESKVTLWSQPWGALCSLDQVWLLTEVEEKNGQKSSDLNQEGGLHAPHPALSSGIYISSQIPLYTQLNKEFSHRHTNCELHTWKSSLRALSPMFFHF